MTVLAFSPRIVDDGDWDPDAQLERVAAATAFKRLSEALVGSDAVAELLALQEALGGAGVGAHGAYWDPEKHPRWPKGTPLAGQFMKVGQRFEMNGKEYDVAAVMPGKIHAHLVTPGGTTTGAQTISIDADHLKEEVSHENPHGVVVKGITRPAAKPITGATAHHIETTGGAGTATVIDAHARPETHDASIPIPEAAKGHITPEEWKRFGKLDQERYSQLMERYGTWTPGKAKTLIDAAKKKANPSIWSIVSSGYKHQYGSSSGTTLSMHQVFHAVANAMKGGDPVEKARNDFEESRALQHEFASAIQWDLYNRAKAPDVSVFHMSPKGRHQSPWNQVLTGKKPIFSGLSTSQHYGANFGFGDNVLAVPLAIRHVVLATISGDVVSHSFASEKEIATADALAVDPKRTTMWASHELTPNQAKWLSAQTKGAASGEVLEKLLSNMNGGEPLPIPPAPASIVMDHQSGKSWTEPPETAKQMGLGLVAKGLKWAHPAAGGGATPKKAAELGLQPGDFIQGNPKSPDKGTVYVIVPDLTDQYMQVAYYKLTEPDGKTPYMGPPQAYHFEGGGSTQFKKIDAHFDWAAHEAAEQAKAGSTAHAFHPEAWTQTQEEKFVGDLPAGTKFKVNGKVWEVVAKQNAAQSKIKLVETGEGAAINNDYKTPWLQLLPGMTEEGSPQFDPSGYFEGAKGAFPSLKASDGDVVKVGGSHYEVALAGDSVQLKPLDGGKAVTVSGTQIDGLQASLMTPKPLGWTEPAPGDTLAIDGKKATVTKLLKDGTVQINTHPGVMKVQPDDPILAGLYSPEKHELGDKAKLKELAPGQKFHGGTGNKVRPYVVLEQQGKLTKVRNLDTGEESAISSAKSFAQLHLKPEKGVAPAEEPHIQPHVADAYDPQAWENGPESVSGKLQPGEKFVYNGVPYEVVETPVVGQAKGVAKNLTDGTTIQMGLATMPVTTLVPKGTASPKPVEPKFASEFNEGDHFLLKGEVYKVVTKHDSGALKGEPVSGVGDPVFSPPGAKFVPVPAPAAPAFEPSEKVLSQMQEGDKFKKGDVTYTVAAFTKLDKTGAHLAVKRDAAEYVKVVGDDGDQAYYPLSSVAASKMYPVVPSEAPAAEANLPGQQLPATAYDPSAYLSGGKKTLGELKVGDVFVGAKNGKHYVVTKTGAKSGLSAIDLMTGKNSGPWTYDKTAEVMHPKAELKEPIPASSLTPGDATPLGMLMSGDHFTMTWDGNTQVYEVVKKASPGLEAPNVTVAPVNPDFSLGPEINFNSSPLTPVTFHALSGDVAVQKALYEANLKKDVIDAPKESVDPSHFPDAGVEGGLTPFSPKSKTGGGYVFTKAKLAGEGSLLQGKDGTVWKVKQAGPYPIVTDGKTHFHVDGDHNLKVVNVPFDDQSPALGTKLEDTQQAVEMTQQEAKPGATIGSLGLKEGDTFTSASSTPGYQGVWKVVQSGTQTVSAVKVGTAKMKVFPLTHTVDTANGGAPEVKVGEKVLPTQLGSGDWVEATSGAKYLVVSHKPIVEGGEPGAMIQLEDENGTTYPEVFYSDAQHAKNKVGGWKMAAAPSSSPTATPTFDPTGYEEGGPVQAATLKPGDVFMDKDGSYHEVVGESGIETKWKVQNAQTGETALFHKSGTVTPMLKPGDAKAAPYIPPIASFQDNPHPLSDLPAGTLLTSGDPGAGVWQVQGPAEDGGINLKIVKAATPDDDTDEVYELGHVESFLPSDKLAKALPPDGMKLEPDTVPLSGIAKGSHVDVGGTTYKIAGPSALGDGFVQAETADGQVHELPTNLVGKPVDPDAPPKTVFDVKQGDHFALGGAVWKSTGEVDGDGHWAELVKPGGKYTAGLGWKPGDESAFEPHDQLEPLPRDAAPVDLPDFIENTPKDHLEGNPKYIGLLPEGSFVKATSGTVFQVVSHDDDNKTTLKVVADPSPGDSFYGQGAPEIGKEMQSSAFWVPTQVQKPKAGDQVDAGDLPVDAEFEDADGGKWTVIDHDSSDGTVYAMPLDHDDEDATAFKGGEPVTMVSHPDEFKKPEADQPKAMVEGGKTTLAQLQPGDHFKSISGVTFQVKEHVVGPDGKPAKTVVIGQSGGTHDAASITPVTKLIPDMADPANAPAPSPPEGMVENNAPVSQMPVGHKFADESGIQYHVVGEKGDGGGYWVMVDHNPVAPSLNGTQAWVSDGMVPPHAAPLPESAAPAGPAEELPANTNKPLGSFAVGDAFQSPDGSIFEIASKQPSGTIQVKLLHAAPNDPVGHSSTFGPTYIPAGVKPGGWTPPTTGSPLAPGEALKGPHELAPGMVYKTNLGNVFEVVAAHKGEDGEYHVLEKLLHIGDPEPQPSLHVGKTFNSSYPTSWQPPGWTVADPAHYPSGTGYSSPGTGSLPESTPAVKGTELEVGKWYSDGNADPFMVHSKEDDGGYWVGNDWSEGHMPAHEDEWFVPQDAPESEEEDDPGAAMGMPDAGTAENPHAHDPLKPYSPKSQTGGGYFFGTLGTIPSGTKFTDKSGGTWEKVSTIGDHHVFKDEQGQHYVGDGKSKVKLLKQAPEKTLADSNKMVAAIASTPDKKFDQIVELNDPVWTSPHTSGGLTDKVPVSSVSPGQKIETGAAIKYQVVGHMAGHAVLEHIDASTGKPLGVFKKLPHQTPHGSATFYVRPLP